MTLNPARLFERKQHELELVRRDIVSGNFKGTALQELESHEDQLERDLDRLDHLLTGYDITPHLDA